MNERLESALQEQATLLLDAQLKNLSERLFEVGKKMDEQLTAWLTFSALTIVLCFGVTEVVSIAGLQLRATVSAAVTYVLACAFYYRVVLSTTALEIWRESLRGRRKLRFKLLLEIAKQQGPEVEREMLQDVNGFVSEYPGYLASSALIKDEALRKGGPRGKYIVLVYKLVILIFSLSPYVLAACLLYASRFSRWYVGVALFGIMITLSANAVLTQKRSPEKQSAVTPISGTAESESSST